jgi:peptidyl-dipeptidase Dcp|tara:strand:+ start:45806 stop:47836 length:2031 start_codon:yes stop_codon:yes gene_type:complete
MNLLLKKFSTQFTTAPFSKIKNEHFKPAIIKGIEVAKKEIKTITSNTDHQTFENTIEALEFSGMQLKRVTSIFFNLNAAETNDEIQKIAQEVSPLLSDFANDIRLNEELFKRVQSIYNKKDKFHLTLEQQTLLNNQYKMFVRNGANLNETKKNKLRGIDKELSKLSLQFGENILAETNSFELNIIDEYQLKGLPDGAKDAAKITAKQKNKKGWLFTLDYPSYIPFMTYVEDRSLREKMTRAFGARAFQNNENDNQQIVLDIVDFRYKRSNLLGYNSHAHFVLEERMAESPENVNLFLNDLLEKAKPAALKEFDELKVFSKKDGISDFQKWDSSYYSEKLKKQLFDFDEEQLKPYFKLENVLNGVFTVANKLYDLNFEEINNIDIYHKDVNTYRVTDENNELVAILYTDFFPRKGKRNGAWMTSFKDQWKKNSENSRPHISIVCNFTKPTETKPSLLTFNEVTTLFHEFGHALHGMLANTTYPSLSGTNVYWDFVELPSQILENWCYEKDALDLFARHYETNETIPMELVEKIKKSSTFLEGMTTLRQLSFGLLDISWHNDDSDKNIKSVKEFENNAFGNTKLFPDVEENCMSTAFSHIFQGGYSSGYYSYKWAEVLDADAFEYFKETGIFNKETAQKFKDHILSKGGTENPMTLYKRFRGQEPNANALLKRAGLLK